jgi:hypothetical protein
MDLPVPQNSMTSLALLLHEFATNAVKYGSLSVPSGCIEVGWEVEDSNVLMTWEEKDRPSLNGPPDQRGFGSELARQIVDDYFGGNLPLLLEYEWPDYSSVDATISVCEHRASKGFITNLRSNAAIRSP